jgi:hypothetical protein
VRLAIFIIGCITIKESYLDFYSLFVIVLND